MTINHKASSKMINDKCNDFMGFYDSVCPENIIVVTVIAIDVVIIKIVDVIVDVLVSYDCSVVSVLFLPYCS